MPPGISALALSDMVRCKKLSGPKTDPAAPSSLPLTGVPTAYGGSKQTARA